MQNKTDYQKYIYKSRYARYLEKEDRREEWEETVQRYIDFFTERAKGLSLEEVKEAILNYEVMPSMRSLMTAGKALERDNVCGYNCFAGNQRYVTQDGLKSFAETCDTTQTVLNGNGNWTKAEIKSFGVQAINKISFKPAGEYSRSRTLLRHEVLATANHRWITINRGEVTDLQVGDKVAFVGAYTHPANRDAFIRGFLFGDGTLDTRGRARVRICGDKAAKLMGVINTYGNCSIMNPPSHDGDLLVVFHKGHFEDSKKLPYGKDAQYLASWLQGYMEADGHNDPKQPGLSTQDVEAAEFVKSIAVYADLHVTGDNTSMVTETNYGARSAPLRRLTMRESGSFTVTSIEEEVDTQEVFCAVVPDTHDFVLEYGIHTGNCSYVAVDSPRVFDEILYILCCGTGVGFSVERQYVNKLPEVAEDFVNSSSSIIVEDSKIGWATALRELIALLYAGKIPNVDYSKIRPAGAVLKTMGGRASGPEPLKDLFNFTTALFKKAKGRKLSSVECHDLVCKIADIVVVGGVRRSALISLSNLTDERMRNAKSGAWWENDGQRALANNSVAYTEKPDIGIFMKEWSALYESKSGERGLFNRVAAKKQAISSGRRDPEYDFGTNPLNLAD